MRSLIHASHETQASQVGGGESEGNSEPRIDGNYDARDLGLHALLLLFTSTDSRLRSI